MKYGMNLLLWSGEVTDDLMPVCEQLKAAGYDGVELPMFNLDLDYAAIGKQLDDIGLSRTSVTIRGEEDNPISCLLYTSPSPRDLSTSRMPSSA